MSAARERSDVRARRLGFRRVPSTEFQSSAPPGEEAAPPLHEKFSTEPHMSPR